MCRNNARVTIMKGMIMVREKICYETICGVIARYISYKKYKESNRAYNDVMEEDEACNNKALPHFNAVKTSVDVDRICTEYSKHAHIDMVHDPEIHNSPNEMSGKLRDNNTCRPTVRHEKRHSSNCRDYKFVSPFEINHIIHETE